VFELPLWQLARLACMLGVFTVILGFRCGARPTSPPFQAQRSPPTDAAFEPACSSPNDNGLLHSELVDFDLPAGVGWDGQPEGGLNPVERCLAPLRQPRARVVGDCAILRLLDPSASQRDVSSQERTIEPRRRRL
jgi:hypothetical protein